MQGDSCQYCSTSRHDTSVRCESCGAPYQERSATIREPSKHGILNERVYLKLECHHDTVIWPGDYLAIDSRGLATPRARDQNSAEVAAGPPREVSPGRFVVDLVPM